MLPANAPAGLCPACLLKPGAATDTLTDAEQPPAAVGLATKYPQLEISGLIGKGELSHARATEKVGTEETAVRVALHRLHKRYWQLLRHVIAQTLADDADVSEEMRALFRAFGG